MPKLTRGRATAEDTAAYSVSGRLPEWAYRPFGRTGLTVSSVGFGTYRVHSQIPAHRFSLRTALLAGCNLIDTSTNYADGGSEEAIGVVLGELLSEERLKREEIVVVSKVGYVQGQNLELALKRQAAGAGYEEMVEYSEGCWHCLHPDFLRDQIELSLDRLGLETLDTLLLHNPEYFLMDAEAKHPNGDWTTLRNEYYRRIYRAFETLEDFVAAGKIAHYGISSNTFGGELAAPTTTSLTKVWQTAEEIGSVLHASPTAHHFSVVQMPINLLESGPVLEKNNGANAEATALEFSQAHGLAVLANRPLNAFYRDRLIRLADYAYDGSGNRVELNLEDISKTLNTWLPEPLRQESLSRKSLGTLLGTDGITSVLVGMRRPEFVEDTLGAAALAEGKVEPGVFKIFRA